MLPGAAKLQRVGYLAFILRVGHGPVPELGPHYHPLLSDVRCGSRASSSPEVSICSRDTQQRFEVDFDAHSDPHPKCLMEN